MKRILFLLTLQFLTFSIYAQETTRKFQLYIFGLEYSGQSVALQKEIESNSELKERLTELDYQYFDVDKINEKEYAYRYMLFKGERDYPFYVVTDTNGDVYMVTDGSVQKFFEEFNPEWLASHVQPFKRDMITERMIQKMAKRSPWRIGVEGGAVISNLAGLEFLANYKTGYYAAVSLKNNLSKNMAIRGGLSLYSLGGQHIVSNENLRLNYLSLPIDFEKNIMKLPFFGCGSDLSLGLGVYGAYLLSDKTPDSILQSTSNWDAGARARLIWQQGSFCLTAGYVRGFLDLFPGPDKAYTNVFQIGLTISLGD